MEALGAGSPNFSISSIEITDIDYVVSTYFSKEVLRARGRLAKVRAKRIIEDSIKDHLIPHVSSVKTPKGSVRCYMTKQSKKNKRLL